VRSEGQHVPRGPRSRVDLDNVVGGLDEQHAVVVVGDPASGVLATLAVGVIGVFFIQPSIG
jgi:hypothetical protein